MPHLKDRETGLCLICHRNQIAAIKESQKFKRNNYEIRKFAIDNFLNKDDPNYRAIVDRHYVRLNEAEFALPYQPPITKFAKKMELDKLNKKIASKSLFKLNNESDFDDRITGRRSNITEGNSTRASVFELDDRINHKNRLASKSNYSIYTVNSPYEDDTPSRINSSRNEYVSKANYIAKKVPIRKPRTSKSSSLNDLVIIDENEIQDDNILNLTKRVESIHQSLSRNNQYRKKKKKIIYYHHFEEEEESGRKSNEDDDYVYYENYL